MMPGISRNTRGRVLTLAAMMLCLFALDALAFPSARRNLEMVWSDEARGIILFGGLSPQDVNGLRYEYGDTWRFVGERWVRLYPENAPSPRYATSMTYDSARRQILLFGGAAGDEVFGDTWAFRSGNWTRIETATAPPARRLAGLAYDPVRDKTVMFGGGLVESRLFDTWEFDGTDWNLVAADGPKVEFPSLVYDAARDEILMLGTTGSEVVMYRYEEGTWVRIEPETLPPCAGQSTMVFREWDGTVLSYGGSCPVSGVSNDTWIWDGTDWTEMELQRSAGSIFGYGMAHDQSRNQTIIYGGFGFEESQSTYRLTDERWAAIGTTGFPGPRTQFVLQPALSDDHLLFFGGQDALDFFADFWRLKDLEWERELVEGTPTVCASPVAARDPQRNRLVILCSSSRTYEFDGEKLELKESKDNPKSRLFSMMHWDPVSRRVIMYGGIDDFGSYLNETWAWDGSQWKKLDLKRDQRPPARMLATTFVDPTSNRIVLAGGLGYPDLNSDFERYEDQWQFDGSKWVEMNPSQKLPQRYGAQVAVDPENQRVLVFGGKSKTEAYLNDMWMWNGSNWSEVEDGPAPSPRMNGRMAWDPSTGSIVLYGGFAGVYYSELWTFDGQWTLIERDSALPRRPVRRPTAAPRLTGEGASSILEIPQSQPQGRRVTLPEEAIR